MDDYWYERLKEILPKGWSVVRGNKAVVILDDDLGVQGILDFGVATIIPRLPTVSIG